MPLCQNGYSLIELLVVLAIVGVLTMVGVSTLGSRSSGSVRSVMDELEGTLAAAHKRSVATGKDVTVAVKGDWSSTTPFLLAYGDSTTQDGTAVSSATILTNGATEASSFHYQANSRDHMHAGVVTVGSDWWATAATGNTALSSVLPFSDASSSFASLLSNPSSDAVNLSALGSVKISGVNKRFTSSFYIAVVGIRGGKAITAGPMGLIVVLNNGATIYKFYNSGAADGTNAWRRM